MTRSRLALVLVLLIPATAAACLWDYDTLAQERSRFPTALELITGKYLRHSPEFYEWRVKDRRKKLATDPNNLALHDDLVVALDRLGKYDEALAVAEAANRLQPNRYETESNWGTVLLHAGKLEEGLAHIDAAVRINPDAHFGREVYQQKLVRWVLDARKAGRTLPVTDLYPIREGSDVAEVRSTDDWLGEAVRTDRRPALKAVLGMMRTGQHEHPVLLESLGRLLSSPYGGQPEVDAKRLATRAYLRASDVVTDPTAKRAYRGMAAEALRMQTMTAGATDELKLAAVEADLRRELADADSWFAVLRAKEVTWVNDPAMDPDAEFANLYAADPEVVGDSSTIPSEYAEWRRKNGPLLALSIFGTVCLAAMVLSLTGITALVARRLRRRAKISAPTPRP